MGGCKGANWQQGLHCSDSLLCGDQLSLQTVFKIGDYLCSLKSVFRNTNNVLKLAAMHYFSFVVFWVVMYAVLLPTFLWGVYQHSPEDCMASQPRIHFIYVNKKIYCHSFKIVITAIILLSHGYLRDTQVITVMYKCVQPPRWSSG